MIINCGGWRPDGSRSSSGITSAIGGYRKNDELLMSRFLSTETIHKFSPLTRVQSQVVPHSVCPEKTEGLYVHGQVIASKPSYQVLEKPCCLGDKHRLYASDIGFRAICT